MDYTNLNVRKQLYRERVSLDEFENDKLGELNKRLRSKIALTEVARQEGVEKITLNIFNNAYYITTAILLDKRSELHLGEFTKIARIGIWDEGHEKHPLKKYFEAVTMGMVCLYMYLCEPDWWKQEDCVLRTQMEKIYTAQYEDEKMEQIQGTFYGDRFFLMERRDEYVADWFYVDKEGNPSFNSEVARCVFIPLVEEMTKEGEAEGYMSELQHMKIGELQEEIKALKQELEELSQPVDGFYATQKVRMELALQLMEKAGMNLDSHGCKIKAAQVLSMMLDIKSPNNGKGNEAKTCAQYVSSRDYNHNRHKETIDKLNPLLKDLNIDIQL